MNTWGNALPQERALLLTTLFVVVCALLFLRAAEECALGGDGNRLLGAAAPADAAV